MSVDDDDDVSGRAAFGPPLPPDLYKPAGPFLPSIHPCPSSGLAPVAGTHEAGS